MSFAWSGFNNAMVSNVGMVLRNIYSKKFLGQLKVGRLAVLAWLLMGRVVRAFCRLASTSRHCPKGLLSQRTLGLAALHAGVP